MAKSYSHHAQGARPRSAFARSTGWPRSPSHRSPQRLPPCARTSTNTRQNPKRSVLVTFTSTHHPLTRHFTNTGRHPGELLFLLSSHILTHPFIQTADITYMQASSQSTQNTPVTTEFAESSKAKKPEEELQSKLANASIKD